ncbi:hypothetical protein SAMD00019534_076780 [Acytostelium subglobosum LB1]|uniref:hypothetical protein n=1 Tax=Acytostelium subglobosum LB1 TaxID=1410327 RepID=UPI000644816D|nr:hypothetical protein SAMD00019534_076780 [Acytostelium subglobosum LB1]GAM24503.1 hypothetical protein SAMD00019534_076780 [Acytostelium subglobosum LB1]|eukprot:XP_012752829.1 hypothetical protein SAMD00019534_076780 [Acytostelium subglobosum LB1]
MDKLPVLLLKKVIGYVDEEVKLHTGIFLSMSCKRLYRERDSYLLLNSASYFTSVAPTFLSDHFHLVSYKDVLTRSLTTQYFGIQLTSTDLFKWDGQDALKRGVVPETTSLLVFGDHFDNAIEPGAIPQSVSIVIMGNDYNQHLSDGILPAGLTYLRMSRSFKRTLSECSLPATLTDIDFDFKPEHPIGVGQLPPALTSLYLPLSYQHPIAPGVIPPSVTTLHLNNIKHPLVPGCIPDSVTDLVIQSTCVMQQWSGVLPRSLTKSYLSIMGPLPVDVLPPTLLHLELVCERSRWVFTPDGSTFHESRHSSIWLGDPPSNLQSLVIHNQLRSLPPPGILPASLTQLTLYNYCHYSSPYWHLNELDLSRIPRCVLHLSLPDGMAHELEHGDIPSSVTKLEFASNLPINPGVIPNSVTHLKLAMSFDQPLVKDSIPSSVTHIDLYCAFNQPLAKHTIPSSVTHLEFGYSFNQSLVECLSDVQLVANLKVLMLDEHYQQPLPAMKNDSLQLTITDRYQLELPVGMRVGSIHILPSYSTWENVVFDFEPQVTFIVDTLQHARSVHFNDERSIYQVDSEWTLALRLLAGDHKFNAGFIHRSKLFSWLYKHLNDGYNNQISLMGI